jgi:hypothetical protein
MSRIDHHPSGVSYCNDCNTRLVLMSDDCGCADEVGPDPDCELCGGTGAIQDVHDCQAESDRVEFNAVADALRALGLSAFTEQTGGGTATLYAARTPDEVKRSVDGEENVPAILMGPGSFAGPGYTNGYAHLSGDLCIGWENSEDGEYLDTSDPNEIAAKIAAYLNSEGTR